MSSTGEGGGAADRAFGAENRARLLDRYFDREAYDSVTPQTAWAHIYRLLMWVDRTIGLAHCYESDKCQPGRPWYARSLGFHAWLSDRLQVPAGDLAQEIDWLFSSAVSDLAEAAAAGADARMERAKAQREPYATRNMPVPGEDAELEDIIGDAIQLEFATEPRREFLRRVSRQVQAYVGSENKRKNLVGEGFEDSLAGLLRRWSPVASSYDIYVRPPLHDLPGFHPPRGGDKTKKVDLALVRRSDGHRVLVSCKWSVRSDREEQFATDFDAYAHLESAGSRFDYVLVTNEFDPARLAAACDSRRQNSEMFSHVVHVNPEGVVATYAAPVTGSRRGPAGGMARALTHIESGRLSSLETWLEGLARDAR